MGSSVEFTSARDDATEFGDDGGRGASVGTAIALGQAHGLYMVFPDSLVMRGERVEKPKSSSVQQRGRAKKKAAAPKRKQQAKDKKAEGAPCYPIDGIRPCVG